MTCKKTKSSFCRKLFLNVFSEGIFYKEYFVKIWQVKKIHTSHRTRVEKKHSGGKGVYIEVFSF